MSWAKHSSMLPGMLNHSKVCPRAIALGGINTSLGLALQGTNLPFLAWFLHL